MIETGYLNRPISVEEIENFNKELLLKKSTSLDFFHRGILPNLYLSDSPSALQMMSENETKEKRAAAF